MTHEYMTYIVFFLVLRLFVHPKAVWVNSFEITLSAVKHRPAVRSDIVFPRVALAKNCVPQVSQVNTEGGRFFILNPIVGSLVFSCKPRLFQTNMSSVDQR